MVIYALLHLRAPSRFLSWKPFVWFNQFTYGFYLIHFAVLCTFSCSFYLALHDRIGYHLLAAMNWILSFVLTTLLSYLMHKFVEKPGIRLAGKIGAYFDTH